MMVKSAPKGLADQMDATQEPDLFNRQIFSVTELTRKLSGLIEAEFGLVWLSGEISNLRRPASGHMYLTLKDKNAQIRAIMFKNQQRYLGFDPEDGQEVLVRGRLTVYEPRGEYQIMVDYMEPRGEGALRLAFEKAQGLAGRGRIVRPGPQKASAIPAGQGGDHYLAHGCGCAGFHQYCIAAVRKLPYFRVPGPGAGR